VWTVLGFYPMNPASGEYVFGSPLVDEAALQLPDGKMLRIIALNNSEANKYIQKVTLNGSPYNSNFFRHGDLMNGGILTIEMGPKPSRKWGKNEDGFPK
jgi:putative alpha-1,2-mannosidase